MSDLARKPQVGDIVKLRPDGHDGYIVTRDLGDDRVEINPITAVFAIGISVLEIITPAPSAGQVERLTADRGALRDALTKISVIRDSIIGTQGFNWSEHAYPLVAALDAAGFRGADYKISRENLGTLMGRLGAAEADRDALREQLNNTRIELDGVRAGRDSLMVKLCPLMSLGARLDACTAERDVLQAQLAEALESVSEQLAQAETQENETEIFRLDLALRQGARCHFCGFACRPRNTTANGVQACRQCLDASQDLSVNALQRLTAATNKLTPDERKSLCSFFREEGV